MSYTLYICNHCKGCEKVIAFLRTNNITLKEINIDTDKIDVPIALLVIPALFKENKIIAYGADIIEHLNNGTKDNKV